MIARVPLPGAAAVTTSRAQILISRVRGPHGARPLGPWPFGITVPPDARIPPGRNGNPNPWAVLLQGLIDFPTVVGCHPPPHWPAGVLPPPASARQLWRRGHRLRSVPRPGFRHFRCPRQVNLAPGAPFRNAVPTYFPFAFSVDLQATAVQNQMQRPFGPLRKNVIASEAKQADLHRSASPGKGDVVRDRQGDSHFLEQGTDKTLCSPVGQVKHLPERQDGLNGDIAIDKRGVPVSRPIIPPLAMALSDTQRITEPL